MKRELDDRAVYMMKKVKDIIKEINRYFNNEFGNEVSISVEIIESETSLVYRIISNGVRSAAIKFELDSESHINVTYGIEGFIDIKGYDDKLMWLEHLNGKIYLASLRVRGLPLENIAAYSECIWNNILKVSINNV